LIASSMISRVTRRVVQSGASHAERVGNSNFAGDGVSTFQWISWTPVHTARLESRKTTRPNSVKLDAHRNPCRWILQAHHFATSNCSGLNLPLHQRFRCRCSSTLVGLGTEQHAQEFKIAVCDRHPQAGRSAHPRCRSRSWASALRLSASQASQCAASYRRSRPLDGGQLPHVIKVEVAQSHGAGVEGLVEIVRHVLVEQCASLRSIFAELLIRSRSCPSQRFLCRSAAGLCPHGTVANWGWDTRSTRSSAGICGAICSLPAASEDSGHRYLLLQEFFA
jgi:hypothetical protein